MQTKGQPVNTYDAHEGGALKKHPVDVFSERASLSRWLLSMPHLTSMVWTNRDELMEASNGTVTSYYQYDAQGNRTRKVVVKPGNIREERYYIGGYEMFYKYVGTTTYTKRETVHVTEERDRFVVIDVLSIENGVTLTKPTTTYRYQYSNHLGSACLELDNTAAIISYEEYHPFGTTSYRSGRNEVDVSLKRYKYIGKERDEETGLYYYGARYYAAWICRFVSVDPLNEKYPELSAYQYASNRPIVAIDLDGLEAYFIDDGTKVGQIGDSQEVRLFNEGITAEEAQKYINYANKVYKKAKDGSFFERAKVNAITSFLEENTTSVGMNEDELYMRAFMTVVRIGEASSIYKISDNPLGYNILLGGEKFIDYSTHPGITAGAYQFQAGTWAMVNSVEKQSGFYPVNQDRAFVVNVEIVSKDFSNASGALDDIYNGNFVEASLKLNRTWVSLPGTSTQTKLKEEDVERLCKQIIANELKGITVIDTPQGQLNLRKVYRLNK